MIVCHIADPYNIGRVWSFLMVFTVVKNAEKIIIVELVSDNWCNPIV